MNIITKIIGFFVFVYCLPAQGVAQVYDVKKLSTNEGLPSGQIGYVQQDSTGYMWLSTYDGLIRYNGFETRSYTIENGLRSDIVNAIYVDHENKLWLATEGGGAGYLQGDSVYYPTDFAKLDTVSVMYITESMDGKMYFTTYGDGLFIWDGDSFEHISTQDGLPSDNIWELHFRQNDEIWLATQEGIAVLDIDRHQVQRIITSENELSGTSVYSFAEEQNGTIWASTSNGVSVFNGNDWRQIKTIGGNDLRYVYDVHVDNAGLVWIGTESDGLYWFDGNEFTHIKKENGLSSNYIYSFYEDNVGQVWVSTDENGVNIFRDKSFKIYSEIDGMGGRSVNTIHNKGDDIWLGIENGITFFDVEQGHKHYKLPDKLVEYKEVWDIEDLENGNFLVLNNYGRLLEFDGQNFSDYGASIKLPFLYINDIHVQNETLWLGTQSGVVKYQDGEYQYFTSDQGLKDDFVWSLFEDQEGYLWAATDQGVSRIEGESIFTVSFEDGINGSSMNMITQSPEGKYYVGTNEGFSEVVIHNGAVQHVRNFKLDPVFLQEPMFLLFDADGNLWQGTNGGLHFFKADQIANHNSAILEGLFFPLQNYAKGVEFNFLSASLDENGDLWFGSYTHGLVKYDGRVPEEAPAPKPFLRNFSVNNETYKYQTESGNGIELEYDQHNVSFQIGGFYYEDPQRIFYEFRLRGSEEEWNRAFNRTEINYTHLPPGNYSFEVRAKSIQSDWSEPISLVSFEVNKPFWNRTWFYGLIILLAIGIILVGVKIFLIYYDKKKLDLLVDQKTRELQGALSEKDVLIKEIHHRVKNNMAVVSGLLDLQMWRMEDGEAKKAVENSKMRIQTMAAIHEKLYQNDNLAEIEFEKFTNDLVSKISSSLKGTGKDIKVRTDVDTVSVDIQLAIPCGLILNEAVSNAFEHAFVEQQSGCVEVMFKNSDKGHFELIIKDNGIGIPESFMNGKNSSLGITLMRALATQVKAEMYFENESGTKLTCIIPK